MSEKAKILTGAGAAVPNKMRLYATWVDRTPSNCIPRLCSLTLTKLQILKPLGSDIATISIAVKMQSSKRTLRSNELVLPSSGLLDTLLDVTFCLQYPHFLKRDGNRLHIFLQRRKRYKNRTILGFKTLAEGVIRMDQVLQKPLDLDLELVADSGGKDKVSGLCARLYILQLSSTPVDQQEHKSEREHDFSDDEDEMSSGEEEVGDLSDSEPIRPKLPHARHNLKQRFVSLLRRFRVPDSEGGRAADLHNQSDIQALFHELESLSCDEDSGPEQDTMSISSTPKPSLRPFFSSSKSLLDSNTLPFMETEKVGDEKTASGSDGNADVCFTDPEVQSDPQTDSPPREPCTATQKQTVRKGFFEQLSRLLSPEDNVLPECIMLISGPENITTAIATRLASLQKTIKVFQPTSSVEVKALLTALYSKINKYCISCSKPGTSIKIVLVGGDTLIGWFVRPYVEILSSKPLECLSYARIFVVPLGMCGVSRQLEVLDPAYLGLFSNETDHKSEEFIHKMLKYISVSLSTSLAQLPIAEAMLTCCDETNQLFIPFVNEVRVGPVEHMLSASVDMDDCSSPPAPSLTPPSSPNVQIRESPWEPLELQIDYWQMPKYNEHIFKIEKDRSKQDGKTSTKGLFKGLQVSPTSTCGLFVNMYMANKEKRQKIMRLGKKKEKEKDMEPRNQNVEGVSRLICSARTSHTTPLKVYIDGVEFSGVKFFQLSSTWQSHVKNLTVSLVGAPLASTEMN